MAGTKKTKLIVFGTIIMKTAERKLKDDSRREFRTGNGSISMKMETLNLKVF